MARLLEVNLLIYKHQKRSSTTRLGEHRQRRADLEVKISDIRKESKAVYGSPRITAEPRDLGEAVSEKTVAKIMQSRGMVGISPRTFKVGTNVVDPFASFPDDLVARQFDQGRLDAVWTSDITYLTCGEGDMYLCAIKDEHSKKVLGWLIPDYMRTELVIDALDMAVVERVGNVAGVIMHSDRGSQFASEIMAHACERYGSRRSMGATGICRDNAGGRVCGRRSSTSTTIEIRSSISLN
jgi:transposase InsO family protein